MVLLNVPAAADGRLCGFLHRRGILPSSSGLCIIEIVERMYVSVQIFFMFENLVSQSCKYCGANWVNLIACLRMIGGGCQILSH